MTNTATRCGKALILGLLTIIAIGSLSYIPKWQTRTLEQEAPLSLSHFQAQNEARRTIVQILGGLLLLFGIHLTWRRIGALEEQVRIADQGQITERYTRAIEQMGNDSRCIRFGGIYALGRIAHDSDRDRETIVNVLMAHIHDRARIGHPLPEVNPMSVREMQAAFSVLTMLRASGEGFTFDLSGVDLRGLDLRGAHLEGALLNAAVFDTAQLAGAFLSNAQLCHAALEEVDLSEARLDGANLTMAHLAGAHCTGADLRGAKLILTDLRSCTLEAANLDGTALRETCLDGASLDGASLVGATLEMVSMKDTERFTGVDMRKSRLEQVEWTGSKVHRTNLQRARVLNSRIEECSFWKSDLEGAIFDGTTFHRPIFDHATLIGADFSRTKGLRTADIAGAFTDETTKFPDDMPDKPRP